jgi:hypothetical protein
VASPIPLLAPVMTTTLSLIPGMRFLLCTFTLPHRSFVGALAASSLPSKQTESNAERLITLPQSAPLI